MLARRNTLVHPHAGKFELPLLVPAFSSKGFAFIRAKRRNGFRQYSELANVFKVLSNYLTTSVLVSAYDIYHGHFLPPKAQKSDIVKALKIPRMVFLDSGGYELVEQFDSTENMTYPYKPKDGFGLEQYEDVISKFVNSRDNIHFVISNFDYFSKGRSLEEQISAARKILRKYANTLSDFIIKPFNRKIKNYHDFLRFSKTDFSNLRGFNIIGVTEKELGKKLIERIKNISLLRTGLDDAGIDTPIHIWGGLDPVITPLYFFAGAEIFDGVSWLRYSYKNGIAVCRESYSVIEPKVSIEESIDVSRTFSYMDNIRFLDRLGILLQQWVDLGGQDFKVFDDLVKDHLERAYKIMHTKFKEI
jgi:hypothetical protein